MMSPDSEAGRPEPGHLACEDFLALCRVLDVLHDGVVMVDESQQIVFGNAAADRMLGYAPNELPGRPLDDLIPGRVRLEHRAAARRFLEAGGRRMMGDRPFLSVVAKSGEEIPVSIAICTVHVHGERLAVAVIRSALALTRALDSALAQAERDPLTQLGNRLHLSRRLHQAVADPEQGFALLFIDLNDFKPLNDRYGHSFGDRVLQWVAGRLRGAMRNSDVLARFGGDEFAILSPGVSDAGQARILASKVAQAFAGAFELEGVRVDVSAAVGCAIHPLHGRSEAELVHAADHAMYRAKKNRLPYCLADGGVPFQP